MIPFISLRDFLEGITLNLNSVMDEVLEKSKGMPVTFVAPSVELKLSCSVTCKHDSIQVGPSNALMTNYYRLGSDSVFDVRFVLKPKGDRWKEK